MQLQGKWVWITGASSGLGEALSYEFANNGANLIISSRKQADLERVKENCAPGVQVIIQVLDVAKEQEQFETITQQLVEQTERIDILINNAGISQRGFVKDTQLSVDRKIMEINYFGAVALTKAVLPIMLQQGSGQFVAMSSLVGKFGSPLRSTYSASKHALHGFFDSLRAETVNDNIKVTIICPGYIHTDVSKNAITGDGSVQGTTDAKTASGLSPEVFARKAVKGIAKGKREFIVGRSETLGIYLKRFFPGVFARIISRVNVT
ncbi:MAG: SDR family oxidoreductase [Bacteroidota bacterium]